MSVYEPALSCLSIKSTCWFCTHSSLWTRPSWLQGLFQSQFPVFCIIDLIFQCVAARVDDIIVGGLQNTSLSLHVYLHIFTLRPSDSSCLWSDSQEPSLCCSSSLLFSFFFCRAVTGSLVRHFDMFIYCGDGFDLSWGRESAVGNVCVCVCWGV